LDDLSISGSWKHKYFMDFKSWLVEVGMGGGGVGSGMTPPLQRPDVTAMADYHGKEQTDPRDPNGQLPPVKKKPRRRR